MRALLSLAGILLAAVGGVIAYRAAFIAPRAAIVITDTGVTERPNLRHVSLGLLLLLSGACLAFSAARPRRRPRTRA
ncbi:MAG: hypothetical protein QOD32_2227 [Pyrinomonadaceae bacterium]|jgi:hypothetical protein|nr:hypothetical protein [Pyrinomonadaceae bacterium]